MGQLAHCPQCAVQLLLPNGSETAQIQCPTCQAIFAGEAAVAQPVAEAVLVAPGTGTPPAPARREPAPEPATPAKRSGSSFFGSMEGGTSGSQKAPNAGPDAALAALLAGRQPLRRADAPSDKQPTAATPPETPKPAEVDSAPMSLAEAMHATRPAAPAPAAATQPTAKPTPEPKPTAAKPEAAPKFNLQDLLNKQDAKPSPEPKQQAEPQLASKPQAKPQAKTDPTPTPSFSVETPAAVPPEVKLPTTEPAAEPAVRRPEPVAPAAKPQAPSPKAQAAPLLAKDFSFDLGKTIQQAVQPTATQPEPATAPQVMPASLDQVTPRESLDELNESFVDDQSDLSNSHSAVPSRRGWLGPVAGAGAGLVIGYALLVVVGGPERDVLGIARVLMGKPSPVVQASALPLGGSPSDAAASPEPETSPDASSTSAPLDPFNGPRQPEGIQVRYDEPAPVMAVDGNPSDYDDAAPAPFVADTPDAIAAMEAEIENAPTYTLADLQSVLSATAEASRIMGEQSMSDPDQVVAVGQAYAELCELAQVVTFLDSDESDPDMMMTRLEAQDVFRLLFEYGHTRIETRQIAERWIDWQSRPHGGVFFAGVPSTAKPMGSVFEYRFQLASAEEVDAAADSESQQDASKTVVVLSESPLELNRFRGAESIGVVGCVIENPAERISGYRGDAPRAVWVTRTLPLSRPSFD